MKIPHPHIWRITRLNGLTWGANEKTCILCRKKIHLPFAHWLKDLPWLDGEFPKS